MLILSRGCDTSIRIGPNITVKVLSIQRQRVKLGVDAPSHVRVLREEVEITDGTSSEVAGGATSVSATAESAPVLVVEDHPVHARLITKALEECSLFKVSVAATGAAAVESLAASDETACARPRLVLLDYYLPDMSGLNVLRHIRSQPRLRTMPVVILSSEDRESVVAECLEAGANAFVLKATHFDDFHRSVTRAAIFWTSECQIPGPFASQPVS